MHRGFDVTDVQNVCANNDMFTASHQGLRHTHHLISSVTFGMRYMGKLTSQFDDQIQQLWPWGSFGRPVDLLLQLW